MPANPLARRLKLKAEKEQSDLGHQFSTLGPQWRYSLSPLPGARLASLGRPWRMGDWTLMQGSWSGGEEVNGFIFVERLGLGPAAPAALLQEPAGS